MPPLEGADLTSQLSAEAFGACVDEEFHDLESGCLRTRKRPNTLGMKLMQRAKRARTPGLCTFERECDGVDDFVLSLELDALGDSGFDL